MQANNEKTELDMDKQKASCEALGKENDYLMEQLKRQQQGEHETLVRIHERLDPDGSIRSIDQTNTNIIENILGVIRLHKDEQAGGEDRIRKLLMSHADDMNEINNRNLDLQ